MSMVAVCADGAEQEESSCLCESSLLFYLIFLQNLKIILAEKSRDNKCVFFQCSWVLLSSPYLHLTLFPDIRLQQSHIYKYILKHDWHDFVAQSQYRQKPFKENAA